MEVLNFDPLYYADKQRDIAAYELLKEKCEDWSHTFFDFKRFLKRGNLPTVLLTVVLK